MQSTQAPRDALCCAHGQNDSTQKFALSFLRTTHPNRFFDFCAVLFPRVFVLF